MMKRIHCLMLLFSFLIAKEVFPQMNLVKNPSFEDTISCPNTSGNISSYIISWTNPSSSLLASPDYYNSCAPYSTGCSVPINVGYQYPKTGSAYTGIFVSQLGSNPPDGREFIEGELYDTLKSGKLYCISVYVNLLEISKYAVNNIGVYLSNNYISSSTPFPLPYTPQVINQQSNQLTDTTNWMLITDTIIANGGEKYIVIGNFFNDMNTDTTNLSNTNNVGNFAYYYIDDVSVIQCDSLFSSVNEISSSSDVKNIRLYPNPNDGTMTLEYQIEENETGELRLYDITGKALQSYNFNSSSSYIAINAKELNSGIYLYDVFINTIKVKTDRIVIVK